MAPRDKAVWVTEELRPQPRDIYDITKLTAEQLCQHVALTDGLPTICLRVSRFWNESLHLKAIYRMYRGVDVRDAVAAHVLALHNTDIQFDVFNISARSPFREGDLENLIKDAPSVILRRYPIAQKVFEQQRWELPRNIDRVYVIAKAEQMLNYHPKHNFEEFIQELNQ